MRSFRSLLCILFAIARRLHASYPTAAVEVEPALAVAPAPIITEAVTPAPAVEPVAVIAPPPVVAPTEYVEQAPLMAPSPIIAPAPIVAPASVMAPTPVVDPAPYVAPAPIFPYAMYSHHYHHRTKVRNVAQSYMKETGHRSDTAMVYEAHHVPSSFEYFPRHFDDMLVAAPWRARLYRKRLAASKKAAKARKSFERSSN